MTGRKQLNSVQRERLNDSDPRWWICESLDTIYSDSRNLQPSEGVDLGSNPSGTTIMKEELLKELMEANIAEANAIYKLAIDYDLLDSQEFLDWQDKLNEISVR